MNVKPTLVRVLQIQVVSDSAQYGGVRQGADSRSAGHDRCRGGPVPAGTYQGAFLVIDAIEQNATLCTSAPIAKTAVSVLGFSQGASLSAAGR